MTSGRPTCRLAQRTASRVCARCSTSTNQRSREQLQPLLYRARMRDGLHDAQCHGHSAERPSAHPRNHGPGLNVCLCAVHGQRHGMRGQSMRRCVASGATGLTSRPTNRNVHCGQDELGLPKLHRGVLRPSLYDMLWTQPLPQGSSEQWPCAIERCFVSSSRDAPLQIFLTGGTSRRVV